MRTFDLTQVEKFRDVFPELTTIEQLETAMLFSLGLTKKEIAIFRGVAYITTKNILDTAKRKLNVDSSTNLLSVFQVMLVLFALCGCIVKK